jgi:predicted lipoprotein with Yx(FWY)xxD motif
MNWGEIANRWWKWLVLLAVAAAFLIPTLIATSYVSLWHVYHSYVNTVSNLTGLNTYLTTAAAVLLFVPFLIGVRRTLSWRSERRHAGVAILLGLFFLYNLALFVGTRNAYFSLKGETLKWYALTPDGVQLYDRAGVDPKYGIELKPVTKDIVRQLDLMRKGEFKPIDPSTATLFNPITGAPQAWFYRSPEGEIEVYDKPGFHPRTGTPLQPWMPKMSREWKKAGDKRARQQAAALAARVQEQAAPQAAIPPYSPPIPLPPSPLGADERGKLENTAAGLVLADTKGMTLYNFDRDTVPGKSACNGLCAQNWPPLAATAEAKPMGAWTVVTRDDGSNQWAYKGKPLYASAKDSKPGDITGEGFNNVWHVAKP